MSEELPVDDSANPVTAPVVEAHDAYASLRLPVFQRYALSYVLAVIGNQILVTAVLWNLYERTHDNSKIGWLGLLNALPVIFLSLHAGHLIDRVSRKKVLLVTHGWPI